MTRTVAHEFYVFTCTSCNGPHAILESFRQECQREGNRKKWYCPYCRAEYSYRESAEDRHKKELAEMERQRNAAIAQRDYQINRKNDALAEAEHFRKSRDGMKGQLVRTKKRIHNGVCPCCTRSFKNLAAHMRTQHPNYGDSESSLQQPGS